MRQLVACDVGVVWYGFDVKCVCVAATPWCDGGVVCGCGCGRAGTCVLVVDAALACDLRGCAHDAAVGNERVAYVRGWSVPAIRLRAMSAVQSDASIRNDAVRRRLAPKQTFRDDGELILAVSAVCAAQDVCAAALNCV